jgi:hypothetical protein
MLPLKFNLKLRRSQRKEGSYLQVEAATDVATFVWRVASLKLRE